jgi:Family of unknown function (DUF5681)
MPKKPKTKQAASITIIAPVKKKVVPRSAYKKGESHPHQFQPGQSGNPSGKARDATRLISRHLRAALPCRCPDAVAKGLELPLGSSWAQAVSMALLRASVSGDISAIRELREYTEGSRQRLQFEDEFGEPLARPLLNVHFVQSNGQGGIGPEEQARIDALDGVDALAFEG